MRHLTRDELGRLRPTSTAWSRFVEKCRFDPTSGCVLWDGGQTSGRGHHAPYGSFWFEGRRWFAHRWAAKYLHGQDIDNMQVDHCCPDGPDTLCVHHLQSITPTLNRELQWIRTQVGLLPPPVTIERNPDEIPFFNPPIWLTVPPSWCMSHAPARSPENDVPELPQRMPGEKVLLRPSVPGSVLQPYVKAGEGGVAAVARLAGGAR